MKTNAQEALMDALHEIIALSVENQIKLDALERIIRETNPLLHELYRGEIEALTEQSAAKRNIALTDAVRAKLREDTSHREEILDEALDATFPASDPVSLSAEPAAS